MASPIAQPINPQICNRMLPTLFTSSMAQTMPTIKSRSIRPAPLAARASLLMRSARLLT